MRDDFRLLKHVLNEIELSMLKGILEGENIPYLIENKGTGAYLNIHSGFNYQGCDVYISEDDFEKAKQLLVSIEEPMADDEAEPWEESYELKNKNKKRLFASLFVLVPLILFVVVLVASLFSR